MDGDWQRGAAELMRKRRKTGTWQFPESRNISLCRRKTIVSIISSFTRGRISSKCNKFPFIAASQYASRSQWEEEWERDRVVKWSPSSHRHPAATSQKFKWQKHATLVNFRNISQETGGWFYARKALPQLLLLVPPNKPTQYYWRSVVCNHRRRYLSDGIRS